MSASRQQLLDPKPLSVTPSLCAQIAARGAFKEAMGTGDGKGKCGARLLEPVMKVSTVGYVRDATPVILHCPTCMLSALPS